MNAEYQRWEKRFSADEYVFGEAPNAFLARQQPLLPVKGKALAVSDGEGRNGVWLAEQGLEVTSFDFSPRGVAKAKALAVSFSSASASASAVMAEAKSGAR